MAAPAPAPKRKMGVIIAVVAVVAVVVVVLLVVLLMGGATKTLTPAQLNTELTSWATSSPVGQFPGLSSGDTVKVSGTIDSILAVPPLTGSMVTLSGTALLFPVTLPSGCIVGDTLTMTLHITTVSYAGQSAEWIQELGTTPTPTGISIPASAISCT